MSNNLSILPELLRGLSEKSPTRKDFLVEEKRFAYRELRESVARTRALFRNMGLEVGGKVAIGSSDKVHVSVLYFACLLEGVAAIVLDPRASASEITVLLTKAEPAAAFMDREIIQRAEVLQREESGMKIVPISKTGPRRTSFSLILKKEKGAGEDSYPAITGNLPGVTDKVTIPEETPGLILFTSGTTSQPKGVVLSHKNIQSQLQTLIEHFQLREGDVLANHLPLHHSDGLNQGPLLAVAIAGSWISTPSVTMQNLGEFLDSIYRERATHLITVPTVLAMMAHLSDDYDDSFSSDEFRFIESTAGHLEENLWREIENRFNTRVVNCYGLTETVCEATYCGPDDSTRKVGTVGKPVGCEARIVTEAGENAGPNEIGELWLRGDNIMDGYYEDREATGKIFEEGWIKSGDLAVCDDEGFYNIVGRISSVIVRGGLNVYPEDVTTVLLQHPQIDSAVTVGINDPMLGERVVSCVATVSDGDEPDVENVFTYCREHMAKEKVPNDILFFEELPYGPSGKVDLKATREMIKQNSQPGELQSSGGSVEQTVFSIASGIFHTPENLLDERSDQDNTDGWDSLAFLELIMSIERTFGIKIPPRDIMNTRTLGDAIRMVQSNREVNKV